MSGYVIGRGQTRLEFSKQAHVPVDKDGDEICALEHADQQEYAGGGDGQRCDEIDELAHFSLQRG